MAPKKKRSVLFSGPKNPAESTTESPQTTTTTTEPESLFSFDEEPQQPPLGTAFFINNSDPTSSASPSSTSKLSAQTKTNELVDLLGEDDVSADVSVKGEVFARVKALNPSSSSIKPVVNELDIFADQSLPVSTPLNAALPVSSQELLDVFGSGPAPIDPNNVTLDITHNKGVLKLTVGELMAKLDRLDKLQGMFNELEKAYKTLSRHNTRINEILGNHTMLKDGVTVGDESKLQQLDSYLLDQKVKIQ
ncbi:hypothetical protein HDU99_007329, partial [Rhizoclosmatium hyalinum]